MMMLWNITRYKNLYIQQKKITKTLKRQAQQAGMQWLLLKLSSMKTKQGNSGKKYPSQDAKFAENTRNT